MLNDYQSMVAAQEISNAAHDISRALTRPSAVYRPSMRHWSWPDARGEYWTASYGGVEARGASPEEAMAYFDSLWSKRLPSAQAHGSTGGSSDA